MMATGRVTNALVSRGPQDVSVLCFELSYKCFFMDCPFPICLFIICIIYAHLQQKSGVHVFIHLQPPLQSPLHLLYQARPERETPTRTKSLALDSHSSFLFKAPSFRLLSHGVSLASFSSLQILSRATRIMRFPVTYLFLTQNDIFKSLFRFRCIN